MTALTDLVVLLAAAVVLTVCVRSCGRARAGRAAGQPSPGGADLLPQLTEELRRCRAEATHWRREADRLRDELERHTGS